MRPPTPSYIVPDNLSALRRNAEKASNALRHCMLCPRQCGVDRTAGQLGFCRTGRLAKVADAGPHFGEETPLVGRHGSGTIFFSHCNLLCTFCQNFGISHRGEGREFSDAELAEIMLGLQKNGCHNINFVTPTHVVPQILNAVVIASGKGLSIPLVFNTGGYDLVETLKLMDGIVDIYMPDFKFWDSAIAEQTCQAPDYPDVARRATIEMHRQVGDLIIDESGLARRGLLLRHLVMPAGLSGTESVMRFVTQSLSQRTYVNIMSQYRPCGRAAENPILNRSITDEEYQAALQSATDAGLTRLDQRRRSYVMW